MRFEPCEGGRLLEVYGEAARELATRRATSRSPQLTTAMHRQVQAQPTEGSSREGIRELRCTLGASRSFHADVGRTRWKTRSESIRSARTSGVRRFTR